MNSVTVGDHILDIYDFPLTDGEFTFTLISSVSTHTRRGGKLILSYLHSLFASNSLGIDILLISLLYN